MALQHYSNGIMAWRVWAKSPQLAAMAPVVENTLRASLGKKDRINRPHCKVSGSNDVNATCKIVDHAQCSRGSVHASFHSTFFLNLLCYAAFAHFLPILFSMLRCIPVSVSCSVSYAMRANIMFPNLSRGLGAVCRKLDMGMLAERPGGFPPNNRRLLSSRTMSAMPHVSATNACSTS